MELFLFFTVLFLALLFTYTNGFHDTANSIATVVGTKVLTPRQAIILAAVTNLIGAFFGLAVAKTISSGIVNQEFIPKGGATQAVLICTLISAIFWNLLTWWYGMPSSSSHALIGSLVGATLAAAVIIGAQNPMPKGPWDSSVKWDEVKDKKEYTRVEPSAAALAVLQAQPDGRRNGTHKVQVEGKQVMLQVFGERVQEIKAVVKPGADKGGIKNKVVMPMVISPILGFFGGLVVMGLLYMILRNWRPVSVNRFFGKAQLASSAFMGFSHGMNDAAKCMGIITLALVGATNGHVLDHLPGWLSFLQTPSGTDPYHLTLGAEFMSWLPSWLQFGFMPEAVTDTSTDSIPTWVVVVCALTMAAGTSAGGWKIIKTMGHKMVKLQPVHGFAAETTAATVIAVAGSLGMPVSTTHAITTSIMGVGCAKRFSALKLGVVERILWAWILTLPCAGGVAFVLVYAVGKMGWLSGI